MLFIATDFWSYITFKLYLRYQSSAMYVLGVYVDVCLDIPLSIALKKC